MEQVPPGFRFYPTEEELISFYLHNKLHAQKPGVDRVIPSLDIYSFEPSQLPEQAGELCHKETEQWFFFVAQQEREARGGRPNRTTATGYWKATGSPSYVYSCNKIIGSKKTMVFYKGKAPSGRKTKWKMNEYKAININQEINISNTSAPSCNSTIPMALRNELCLCRVYITSGCARAFDRRPPPPAPTMTTLNNISTLQHNDDNNNNNNHINISSTCNYNMRLEIGQGSGTTSIDRCTQNATINNNNNNNNKNIMFLDEKSSSIDDSYNSAGEDGATTQGNNIIYDDIDIGIDIEMGETLDTSIDWEGLGCL